MINTLEQNTLLLLFIVIAIGYLIGNIKVGKFSIGVAAVLFTGLFFGSLSTTFNVPNIIIYLGLSIFVYTIGLSSGPGFFRAITKGSKQNFSFLATFLIVSVAVAIGVAQLFHLDTITLSSLYAGGHTNTPALASLLDILNSENLPNAADLQERAVIGYSLSYPTGVLGVMLALYAMIHMLGVNFKKEEESLKHLYPVKQQLKNRLVEVTNSAVEGKELRTLKQELPHKVVFGRLIRDDDMILTNYDTVIQKGDHILLAADEEHLDDITTYIGKESDEAISNFQEYAERRIFVSNPNIAGRTLSSLDISRQFSAIVSRVTRGDNDILASGNTVLELGDRVRVVGRNKDIPKLKTLFGDSYDALGKINLLSFGTGLALGLLLGMFTIQFSDSFKFNLGYAGGPLIMALLLGNLRRTGKLVWSLPYSANMTLQQFGLAVMLAGIGINSGGAFFDTIITREGLYIFTAGVVMVFLTAIIVAFISHRLLKIPMSLLLGMMSNQPAILDFANVQTENSLPNVGYTTLLPMLIISKLIVVQLLYIFLS